jgi:hypothetical protein
MLNTVQREESQDGRVSEKVCWAYVVVVEMRPQIHRIVEITSAYNRVFLC